MKLSIRHFLGDLDRVDSIVRTIEQELDTVCRSSPESDRLAGMREGLGEVHARLDGVREFILACERRAAHEPQEQDIDLWL